MLNYSSKLVFGFSHKARQILPTTRISRKNKLIDAHRKAVQKDQRAEVRGVFLQDLKQPRYEHKSNYNTEQYKDYDQKIKEAQQLLIQQEQELNKESKGRPRLYDRPKFDFDLTNYQAWILVSDQLYKEHSNASKVVCKINVAPRDIRFVFGEGTTPWRNESATKEYDFQDSDLSKFLIYDHKQTTNYKPNSSDAYYAVYIEKYLKSIDHIKPRNRQIQRPSVTEFWSQSEPQEFRVNCSTYGDFKKFRHWFGQQISEGLKQTQSFHDRVLQKYPVRDLYEDYDKVHTLDDKPAVYTYDRSYFLPKGQKLDNNKIFQEKIEAPKMFNEDERITVEQYLEIQRQEKIEQQKLASRS